MNAGSCPDPPPVITPTLPRIGAWANATTFGLSASLTRSPCALTNPRTVSSTTKSGSLMNLCIARSSPRSVPVRRVGSNDRVAAVDEQIRPRDHIGAAGGQEHRCGGDLLRQRKATGRDAQLQRLALRIVPRLLAELGQHDRRRNGVDADAVLAPFGGEHLAQPDDAEF